MITKICTDIDQSKKLTEILPKESSDMYYHNRIDIPDNFPLPIEWKHGNPLLSQEIPCWSLAALRACLPAGINIDGILYVFESHNTFDNEWVYEYKFEDISAPLYSKSSNEIDACVKMIIKLNKQNLL